MHQSAGDVISKLFSFSSRARKEKNEYFFKTGKSGYAADDKFVGVSMPNIRKTAQEFKDLDFKELKKLLYHEVHELRLCALVILVLQYKSSASKTKKEIVGFYLTHKYQVNNWDLVDVSAHYILGQAILDGLVPRTILDDLTQSDVLWDRRIAIVANWIMIRSGDSKTILDVSKKLLGDPEDLIHKAIGWMLREAWKREPENIQNFLITNYKKIHRTTMRYAIERMEEPLRKQFLKGDF